LKFLHHLRHARLRNLKSKKRHQRGDFAADGCAWPQSSAHRTDAIFALHNAKFRSQIAAFAAFLVGINSIVFRRTIAIVRAERR